MPRGFTAEQLASRAKLASATVYRAERGLTRPSEETMAALAEALGVSESELHEPEAATAAAAREENGAAA